MSDKLREIYSDGLKLAIRRIFPFWQRLGIHIVPNHFHAPVPDTRTLKDDLWTNYSELVGIDINEKKQLELLSVFVSKFKSEYDKFPKSKPSKPYEYYVNNINFSSVDGEILYCMIRYFKPERIFEIGSGYSTYLAAQAILKNKEEDDDYECKLVAIEPYPNKILKTGFPGFSKLIPKKIQDIPLSAFKKLTENDILFIDSSHVLKIGNDVQYIYLEILPRLNRGIIVHCHDIFLPLEYPKEWIIKLQRFWTEQYLLQAFLTFNDSFEVLWAGCYLLLKHPDKLEEAFSSYKREEKWPQSFWMKKKMISLSSTSHYARPRIKEVLDRLENLFSCFSIEITWYRNTKHVKNHWSNILDLHLL